jgi:hypothetical protein
VFPVATGLVAGRRARPSSLAAIPCWYVYGVEARDPNQPQSDPTLYEWVGGLPA